MQLDNSEFEITKTTRADRMGLQLKTIKESEKVRLVALCLKKNEICRALLK